MAGTGDQVISILLNIKKKKKTLKNMLLNKLIVYNINNFNQFNIYLNIFSVVILVLLEKTSYVSEATFKRSSNWINHIGEPLLWKKKTK